MKIAVISDIHANLSAFNAIINDCNTKYGKIQIIHLGDCIDYGMRPNETISELEGLKSLIIVNIKGNHERALLGFEKERFSSPRGVVANNYTKSILTQTSLDYIAKMQDDFTELEINGKKILCVHGDLSDRYWGKMKDDETKKSIYLNYDYIISGHTHIPSLRTVIEDKSKKTVFINPGSVGQPRNLKPSAQYCVIDFKTDSVDFNSVPYDIEMEQSLYSGQIDEYYKERLSKGI